MKKDILAKGAILQRDRERYAIAPHIPGGMTDTATLRRICDVADRYGLELKITSAQRIALFGIREEDLDTVWAELGTEAGAPIGLCVRSIKICHGTTWCKRGVQDSVSLGLKIDAIYHGRELPNKMKMGVAGCMISCTDVMIKDIGVMGTVRGWSIYVGGNGGPRPRFAELLAENIATEEEVLAILARVVDYYAGSGREVRIGRIVEEMGIEAFRAAVLGADSDGAADRD